MAFSPRTCGHDRGSRREAHPIDQTTGHQRASHPAERQRAGHSAGCPDAPAILPSANAPALLRSTNAPTDPLITDMPAKAMARPSNQTAGHHRVGPAAGRQAPAIPPVAKRRPTRRSPSAGQPAERQAPAQPPGTNAPANQPVANAPANQPGTNAPATGHQRASQPAERQRSGHPAGHQRAGQPCQISPQGRSRSAPHLLTRYPNTAKNPPVGSEIRKMHMRERVYSLQTGYATK